MRKNVTRLSMFALILMLVLSACGGGQSAPVATEAPAGGDATEASVATEAPAATEAPMAYEGMMVAAPDCEYGGEFKSIEAVDEFTVKVTLCVPDPAFPSKIAFTRLSRSGFLVEWITLLG